MHRAARLAWLSACLLTAPLAACGEAPRSRLPPRPSLLEGAAVEAESGAAPARYRYHPPQAAALHARVLLPDGGVLLSGERGERWLVRGDRAEAAAELSPESLLGIEVLAGGFVFVGKSGTTYHAETPLGPFVRSSAPPIPFARVRAAGGALMGIAKRGALYRSEDGGASWQLTGPEGAAFEDAMIRQDGAGLALAVPEALWETRNGGVEFRLLETPPFGAAALFLDEARRVVVVGPLGPRLWEPTSIGPASFSPLPPSFTTSTFSLGASVAPAPSAEALSEGRAVVLGSRWLEVRDEGGGFRLVSGTFGERLERAGLALPLLRGCVRAWLVARGDIAYLACTRSKAPDATQPIALFRSTDGASTWKDEPYVVEGRSEELLLGVASDGEMLITGICSPETRGPGCRPAGVFRRARGAADGGPSVRIESAHAPSLTSVALALSLSPDGRTAYLLGKRTKGEAITAFVSQDSGRSFEGRDVELLGPSGPDEARSRGRSGPVSVTSAVVTERAASFVIQRGGQPKVLVLDDAGRVVSVAEPPAEGARLGAAGERLFAFNAPSREAWESLDAGATWASLGKLRVDPCPPTGTCRASVACVEAGCVVGDRVSRVGWREPPRRTFLAPGGGTRGDRREQKVGVSFVCTLDRAEWKRLPGVEGAPGAAEAAIGKAAWFAAGTDPATGSVTSFRMRWGAGDRLEEIRLLEPSRHPESVAFAASPQVEGVAALRFALPTPEEPGLRNLELAWDDVLSGRVGRAALPDAGPYRAGDYESPRTAGAARRAAPALLSIASGGLYVRPHAAGDDAQATYFADGKDVRAIPPVKWPASAAQRGRAEMVHVGQSHLALRFDGSTAVRATPAAGAGAGAAGRFEISAVRLGWVEPSEMGITQNVSIGYLGTLAGVQITFDPEGPEPARALLYPFRETGAIFDAPTALPTQEDLPLAPRACTAADRSTTPRVVAPFQAGVRRPVIVADPLEAPRELLTGHAVLHGTPKAPCVAAYEAVLLGSSDGVPSRSEGPREVALVSGDETERSWLFRTQPAQTNRPGTVEYRAMACRPDPAAEVPIEVFREAGTHVVPP